MEASLELTISASSFQAFSEAPQPAEEPVSTTGACTTPNDASRRRRVNRSARLKQCKLDARREQWLAQVSGKVSPSNYQQTQTEGIEDSLDQKGTVKEPIPSTSKGKDEPEDGTDLNRTNSSEENFESRIRPCCEEFHNNVKDLIFSDVASRAVGGEPHEAASYPSFSANMQNGDTREIFKDKKIHFKRGKDSMERIMRAISLPEAIEDGINKSCGALSLSKPRSDDNASTSISGSCPEAGSIGGTRKDDADAHVEDDWEAAADALSVEGPLQLIHEPKKDECPSDSSNLLQRGGPSMDKTILENGMLKPDHKYRTGHFGSKIRDVGKAWRPDDRSRPSSLPRLVKQHSFPLHSGKPVQGAVSGFGWGLSNGPIHCPICIEELDITDFSFVPCSCGFRLCLFCHHKISLDDGRCPGCRRFYNSDVAMKFSSSSTIYSKT